MINQEQTDTNLRSERQFSDEAQPSETAHMEFVPMNADWYEQPPQQEREPSPTEVAVMIADQLGETEADPRSAIIKIAHTLGSQACLALLQKTQEMEAAGGMMTSNGKHRLTPGAAWFHPARVDM